tara:strand:+ start:835 stop:1704 length:870 start_codon:yes stop_codon:yes gene_type:complete
MSQKKKRNDSHQVDLLNITRGYSILHLNEKELYFKHPSVLEILENESLFYVDINKSVRAGIKKEEDILLNCIRIGSWSEEESEKIKSLEWMIKKSTTALSKIQDPKQREIFNNQIKQQEDELSVLEDKRRKLVQYSAEHLAAAKKASRLLKNCLFEDLEFTKSVEDGSKAVMLFAEYGHLLSKETLLNASYHGGFFDLFAAQSSNPMAMFNATFDQMTVFQKSLIVLSNSLLNKIKNTKIPEELQGDPVKMLDYEEKEETDGKVTHGVDDLKMKMRARGGKLKAEDFLS